MLAYRHLFHAGNFADVFKHALLTQLVLSLQRKDKPFLYLDTHAGIGRYDLSHAWAEKNREFDEGVARIFNRRDCPETVRAYLDAVRAENPDEVLRFYPGSPLLVQRLLRPQDRMVLTELNKDDCHLLQDQLGDVRRVHIRNMDGYQALKAFLPPPERRGLILLDSSFDRANEFARVKDAIVDAHKRFATGVYAVWYPLMDAAAVNAFEQSVVDAGLRKVLKLELTVHPGNWSGSLRGSAMLLINPPYQFDSAAAPMLHWLWQALSARGEGRYSVKWLAQEQGAV